MIDVQIIPYRAEHLAGVEIRDLAPEHRDIVQSFEYLRMLENMGPGKTLQIDGVTVASIVFCKLLYRGVAEVVVLFGPLFEKYKRTVHRICRKCCDDVQTAYNLHRVEAKISLESRRDRRWAESMGFKVEGRVEAFGPQGQDYVQYARVRRDLICPLC